MTDERDTLDAQSYHLLRIADIVGSLGGYVAANRPLPSAEQFSGTTLFDFSRDSKRKIIRDLSSISEKIQKDFKHIFELRQQFWHPDAYSRTTEESQQAWQSLAASIPDDKLAAIRETLRTSIDSLRAMRYGAQELSAKQRTALTEMGLYRSIEAIELLDTEISKVQAVRAQTPSLGSIRESAMFYRRSIALVGSNSAERNNLAHQFYDNGNLRPEPYLTPSIRARFATIAAEPQTEKHLWLQLEEQLKAGMLLDGNLPDGISELLKLVDVDKPEARAFQGYMEGLVHKLLPGWDFKAHPIRFFISDTDAVNASVVSEYTPALMFFNKGLLKLVGKNENMLLHVIGHELGHKMFADAVGRIRITKPEEVLVNLPNLQWMYENGIDPRGALEFAKKIKKLSKGEKEALEDEVIRTDHTSKESKLLEILVSAADEHPNPALDVDILNSTLAAYRNRIAGSFEDCKKLEIPKAMRDAFVAATHTSPILERARTAKFEEMSWEKQLEFINRELKISEEGHVHSRAEALHGLLQSVENDLGPRSSELGNQLIETLRGKPQAFDELYQTAVSNLFNVGGDTLVPPLSNIIEPLRRIEAAKSPSEFQAAIADYLSVRHNLAGYPVEHFPTPRFFAVQDPMKTEVAANAAAPWNRQVKWAVEAAQTGDRKPMEILLSMGVEDPRLFDLMAPRALESLTNFTQNNPATAAEGFKVGEPRYASNKRHSAILSAYEFKLQDGNLILSYPPSRERAWNFREAAEQSLDPNLYGESLNDRGRLLSQQKPSAIGSIRTPEEFNSWLIANERLIVAPEVLTRRGTKMTQFASLAVSWLEQDAATRKRLLSAPVPNARYTNEFYEALVTHVIPYQERCQLVADTFRAQLAVDPNLGRTLVRNFYLNESNQPGLRRMLESGDQAARLSIHNPLMQLLRDPAVSGLLTIEEKAVVVTKYAGIPSDRDLWNDILKQGPDDKIKGFTDFLERFGRYSAAVTDSKNDDGLRFSGAWGVDSRQLAKVLVDDLTDYLDPRSAHPDSLIDILLKAPSSLKEVLDEPFVEDQKKLVAKRNEDGSITDNALEEKYRDAKLRNVLEWRIQELEGWPQDIAKRAAIYKRLDEFNLFPNDEYQKHFTNTLLADIRQTPDAEARLNALNIIVGGEQAADPQMRKNAAELWVSSVKSAMATHGFPNGLDDGSERYSELMKFHIEWAEKHVPHAERHTLFSNLATAVESQRAVSYRMRDSFKITAKGMLESDVAFRAGEAIMMISTEDANNRQALLDYILGDETEAATEKFAKRIMKIRQESEDNVWLLNREEINRAILDSGDPKYYVKLVRDFHRNFWHAPLPLRVAGFDQLLMSHDEKDYSTAHAAAQNSKDSESAKAFKRSFDYVADLLLPEDVQYSSESRKSLQAYCDVLPPNERGLFLAAMLAASDAAKQTGGQMPVGDRLAIMLEMMGPAEIKFGQALSNYPDAPMDIRKPMVRLTKSADPSPRWALWERYEDVVPEAVRSRFSRMGKVMGNGSYQESIKLEGSDGDNAIIKLQRASIERRAEAGFKQLRSFVERIRQDSGLGDSVADASDRIVKQAQDMAARETNAEYRLEQIKKAQQYYNGTAVAVDGVEFRFQTADWLAYGVDRAELDHRTDRKEWCLEKEMRGVHFDELPSETEAQVAYKKAAAKATVMHELQVLLSGQPIDNDRHPAQLRVDVSNNGIGLFDHGALDLTPPTRQEKQILAKVFAATTQAYQEGASLPQLFYEQLDIVKKEHGSVPDYLVKVERGVLAMSKFFEHVSATEMKDILVAIRASGSIDQDILDTPIKVKVPVLGEREVKLSTALDYGLPKKSPYTITLGNQGSTADPQRYDYVHKTDHEHPVFQGVRVEQPPANAPRVSNGSSRSGAGTMLVATAMNPLIATSHQPNMPELGAVATHTQQTHGLMGTIAGNDSATVIPHIGGNLAEVPALTPAAQLFQQVQAQPIIAPETARSAANDTVPVKPANLAPSSTSISVGEASNDTSYHKPTPQSQSLPSIHAIAAQRHAIQSGAGNGIGVAMGAYGLYSKFNDKDGTFHEDMKSGDTVRQTAAVTGVFMDFANIGAGAVSTAADAKTFQQAKVKAPAGSAPAAPVNGAPSTAAAAPTAQAAPAATAANPAQASTPSATAPKATASTAPTTATTSAGTLPANTAPVPQPPSTTPQAQGGTNAGSTAQQAEKVAAEALKDSAKAAQELSKAGEKLLKAGKVAGKVAIPLALATGAVDATAGARAGDRERVAGAVGSTGGGILGGMALGMAAGAATGAIWGSAVPGVGTIVVGVAAGLVGGIAGAVVGEEAAKHYLSGVMGKLTGADDKFLEAMKQLDPATQKQFAKAGVKLTLDDVHEILKSGKMDSVDHVDTNKDGKLTGAELKAALEKARSVFIDNQLTEQLASLEVKGWGKNLGNKDGKLTLDELKAALPKGFDLASLDKDKSGTISGKEITDAIAAAQATAATTTVAAATPARTPVAPVASQARH